MSIEIGQYLQQTQLQTITIDDILSASENIKGFKDVKIKPKVLENYILEVTNFMFKEHNGKFCSSGDSLLDHIICTEALILFGLPVLKLNPEINPQTLDNFWLNLKKRFDENFQKMTPKERCMPYDIYFLDSKFDLEEDAVYDCANGVVVSYSNIPKLKLAKNKENMKEAIDLRQKELKDTLQRDYSQSRHFDFCSLMVVSALFDLNPKQVFLDFERNLQTQKGVYKMIVPSVYEC